MKKGILIAAHTLFWILILSFFLFFVGPNVARNIKVINPIFYTIVNFGVYGLINISIFYVSLFVVIPLTADRKKYGLFILMSALLVVVYGLLKYAIAYNFKDYYLTVGPQQLEVPKQFKPYILSTLVPSGFMLFFSVVYKAIAEWFRNDSVKKELTHQKSQAELQFLKSQINPHFLFNTLNNIYALAYKKSDDAPAAILKLSEIMRYMLKESDDYKVNIEDELKYLQSYIDLNSIRYKEGVFLNIDLNLDSNNYRIMPMLLISFIENIFKHGLVNDSNFPVLIKLDIDKGKLNFSSSNTVRKGNKDESSGIGLKNIMRRLDLMYPNNYKLKIKEENNLFQLTLSINLN